MMQTPTGTVTFLFTDIEGSTRLWELHPEAMKGAVARHDVLLRTTIEGHGGLVFKTVGDAFCAAFQQGAAAVEAAFACQRALVAEDWGEVGELRVRMALHSGDAEERDLDYFGPTLNRCARLLSIGHGQQVLLSAPTHEIVRNDLPAGAELLDLEHHRLRDLSRTEHVWQLRHPALRAEFPALRSLDSFPNNLPILRSRFIGRDRELAAVRDLLGKARLVTLTGGGGSGKTRLALQVAAELLEDYPGGAWFVDLASVAEPEMVASTAASALGLREEPKRSIEDVLVDHLREMKLLLVIDNCEHLIEASARLADQLLASCPEVRIVATSREALRVEDERAWLVPTLEAPDAEAAAALSVEQLTRFSAVSLFIDRAVVARPGFAITKSNAPAVAEVCLRLDGIPLAIELAAARVRSLSPKQILERLSQRFRLLTGGRRTALPRQQTLLAAIDWSWALLSAPEQRLLARLSVFSGGWTLDAAEAVCGEGEIEAWEVLDLIEQLADKSLVSVDGEEEIRYRLLETVEQYAAQKLNAFGETETLRVRHLDTYRALAEEAAPELAGTNLVEWLDRLEADHANITAATRWAIGCGKSHTAVSMIVALRTYWEVRGHVSEGRATVNAALQMAEVRDRQELYATMLNESGSMAVLQGDHEAARAAWEESLPLWQQLEDDRGVGSALNNLGMMAKSSGDYARARARCEQALSIFREIGDQDFCANALNNLGNVASEVGDADLARARYAEALAIRTETGDKNGIASLLNNMGTLAEQLGEVVEARSFYEQALVLARELGDRVGIAQALCNVGTTSLMIGDVVLARRYLEESLPICLDLGHKRGTAYVLQGLGDMCRHLDDIEAAELNYAESLRLCAEMGLTRETTEGLERFACLLSVQSQHERALVIAGAAGAIRSRTSVSAADKARKELNRHVKQSTEAIGDEMAEHALEAGRALTVAKAVELALQDVAMAQSCQPT